MKLRGKEARGARRYRVYLSVTHSGGTDAVEGYADNLSEGGLFVRGAHTWDRSKPVTLHVTLPSFGSYELTGEIAHIVGPGDAQRAGRHPGAGLRIAARPIEFDNALSIFLARLDTREKYSVLVVDDECAAILREAGYAVHPATHPSQLAEHVQTSEIPVLGVVVPRAHVEVYEAAAAAAGLEFFVFPVDFLDEIDKLLLELDAKL